MIDTRKKNATWIIKQKPDSGDYEIPVATMAVLMDIRDELQTLNRVVSCCNFLDIPFKLDAIKKNTTKPKRKKKPAK